MQLQIDGLVDEDRDNKNMIQGLLEDKKHLQRLAVVTSPRILT